MELLHFFFKCLQALCWVMALVVAVALFSVLIPIGLVWSFVLSVADSKNKSLRAWAV